MSKLIDEIKEEMHGIKAHHEQKKEELLEQIKNIDFEQIKTLYAKVEANNEKSEIKIVKKLICILRNLLYSTQFCVIN